MPDVHNKCRQLLVENIHITTILDLSTKNVVANMLATGESGLYTRRSVVSGFDQITSDLTIVAPVSRPESVHRMHCTLLYTCTVHCCTRALYNIVHVHCTLLYTCTVHCCTYALYTVVHLHCTLLYTYTVHCCTHALYTVVHMHCTLLYTCTVHCCTRDIRMKH